MGTHGGNAADRNRAERFEAIFLPHLDAAYNLARWLTRNDHDAEDVVQEAYLRALKAFDTFQAEREGKPWLLRIVRNTCYTWLRQNRPEECTAASDETLASAVSNDMSIESALIGKVNADIVRRALHDMALEFREVLILRELEGQSYKEIAQIVGAPLGTVMSRLSRGRRELQSLLEQTKGTTK